jgi:mono/diheme cytochrome c family protein
MMRGSAIYNDNCAACHMQNGEGEKAIFPSLRTNSVAQADNPESLIHIVLQGSRRPATSAKPTAFAMPEFASKLSDDDIADVLTYVRNSWGNQAAAVDSGKVGDLRKSLLHGGAD